MKNGFVTMKEIVTEIEKALTTFHYTDSTWITDTIVIKGYIELE